MLLNRFAISEHILNEEHIAHEDARCSCYRVRFDGSLRAMQ